MISPLLGITLQLMVGTHCYTWDLNYGRNCHQMTDQPKHLMSLKGAFVAKILLS